MKKIAFALLLVVFLAALTSCGTDLPAEGTAEVPPSSETVEMTPTPEPDVVTVVDIIDRTEIEPLLTADALEGFWYDDEYTYYFASIKSHYVIVHYSDGTSQPLKEAMADFRVTIEDLDRFGIQYSRAPMREVADLEYREGVLTALGRFWSDLVYDYYFPCMDTKVTVIFTNGTRMELTEALDLGFVSVDILDEFDILYYREPRILGSGE